MPFCTECGHENPPTAKFCSQCGHKLVSAETFGGPGGEQSDTGSTITFGAVEDTGETSALSPEDAAALDGLPAGSALLVVQRGPSAGSRFLLDTDEVTAGRHPDSDIFLDDVTVSRRHATFHRGPQGYTVSDVGSLNGTYVNRDRIDEIVLSGGDEVQIGKFRLVYYPSAADSVGHPR
jgi:pSer/pThr/pTyr-binding forkhead associated (FHA) protein